MSDSCNSKPNDSTQPGFAERLHRPIKKRVNTAPEKSLRLDVHLVECGLFPSRARAQAALKAGLVRVDGIVAEKPSKMIETGAKVSVDGDVHTFVSRGGVKLEAALRLFAIDPNGMVCLDLGASTGGFTDLLLRRGAAKIYAIDVGSGQLHPKIAADPRVVDVEKTHAKDLSRALVPDDVDLIVCDVSFISLKKALPYAMALAAPRARLAALIKPQFEVGRSRIGKGGIVKDGAENNVGVADDIAAWLNDQSGWAATEYFESPIKGGDGNREFLIGAFKAG